MAATQFLVDFSRLDPVEFALILLLLFLSQAELLLRLNAFLLEHAYILDTLLEPTRQVPLLRLFVIFGPMEVINSEHLIRHQYFSLFTFVQCEDAPTLLAAAMPAVRHC